MRNLKIAGIMLLAMSFLLGCQTLPINPTCLNPRPGDDLSQEEKQALDDDSLRKLNVQQDDWDRQCFELYSKQH